MLSAFITNLGKYNEGALVGEWVEFPTTADALSKVFKRIGIGSKDAFGQPYEEWFITDYSCSMNDFYDLLGEYANLNELNYLAVRIEELNQSEIEVLEASFDLDCPRTLADMINRTFNLECYMFLPDVFTEEDLGRYYVEELGCINIPCEIASYFDYEAYGRDVRMSEVGIFTKNGYIVQVDSESIEYDGEEDSIPEEYIITK